MNLALRKEYKPYLKLLQDEKRTMGSLGKILRFPLDQSAVKRELHRDADEYGDDGEAGSRKEEGGSRY